MLGGSTQIVLSGAPTASRLPRRATEEPKADALAGPLSTGCCVHGEPASSLDQVERLRAGLGTDHVAEQTSELSDVRAELVVRGRGWSVGHPPKSISRGGTAEMKPR